MAPRNLPQLGASGIQRPLPLTRLGSGRDRPPTQSLILSTLSRRLLSRTPLPQHLPSWVHSRSRRQRLPGTWTLAVPSGWWCPTLAACRMVSGTITTSSSSCPKNWPCRRPLPRGGLSTSAAQPSSTLSKVLIARTALPAYAVALEGMPSDGVLLPHPSSLGACGSRHYLAHNPSLRPPARAGC
jgi:hypothetical protein